MSTQISYQGITWTFSKDQQSGTFANGEPWVVGPVTVINIDPNPSQSKSGTQHGSMINPIPNKNFGFDSSPQVSRDIAYEAAKNVALSFPILLNNGDVLVSARSQGTYPTYLKTVCALTVLSSAPPVGSFRPSIFGTDRTIKYNINQIDWSLLKSLEAQASTPKREEILAMVPPLPWFEWAGIWSGNSLQPTDNTADGDKQYGRETAAKFGQVVLWLNTNQTLESKKEIVIRLIQNGIDIFEYVKNGGAFYHDGGHKCGRKLPLVFAAALLNSPELKTLAGNPDIFQEDTQTFFVKQSDVGRVICMDYPGYVTATYTQSDVGLAEWGIRHRWEPFYDNRTWNTGYRMVVGPGMMGAWIAATIMGLQSIWNHPPAFEYMKRYSSIAGNGGVTQTQIAFNNYMFGYILNPIIANPVVTPESFAKNTRIITIKNTNVRGAAGLNQVLFGVQTPESAGTIIDGPISADSFTWWKVDFDNGVDGWCGQDNFKKSLDQTLPPKVDPIVVPPSPPKIERHIEVLQSLDNGVTYQLIGSIPYPLIKGQKYKTKIVK